MSFEPADVVASNLSAAVGVFLDQGNGDDTWMLITGFLVFFMHAGFSMLEAGSVQKKNVVNIMFKNIATITIGGLMYWAFGFAFAYGTCGNDSEFIGSDGFFGEVPACENTEAFWFFQFAFAATAATIVSGAVAGRITLGAYFIVAAAITGFVYPVVTNWIWSSTGFLSAFNGKAPEDQFVSGSIGMIDFAGSGVVHLTGGVAALIGAIFLGPRQGRFEGKGLAASSYTLQTLGTFILWFGWFGFNCGSTLVLEGVNTAKVATTTVLSPSAACVTAMIYSRVVKKRYDLSLCLNAVLGGLVGITAGCVVVVDAMAIIIGMISALIYIGSANLLEKLKIDDPIGASPVHLFCGIWGVIAVGIFIDADTLGDSYSADPETFDQGAQFGQQIVGIVFIILWVGAWSTLLFASLMGFKKSNRTKFLRVTPEIEEAGMDASEHGGDFETHF
mmetsp:Transcript_6837/g.8306  ORF Transcript_6837/g.8306 Transcript_6837/m.8306 type:complete len:446 (+) Transcript_6837:202-1539(+)|eukprot:CAMPEP_0204842664 /NCGR_PEP_ID=MMETSP1346-20131115/47526_1 /ASSEMBLY_ACC=CAM_ASM_000771 /TAXON_ID=215587 /ORGANISM="Aplanochytrium stocchinoi, Strain GSBS06" /LENGTH=445 /DNA_ID=CAMNT_0051981675 /DNA_START=129 /DNA_END=1466 /DNA_ORIENTATION=+